jgi:fructose-specific phosphotransferase system IIA component
MKIDELIQQMSSELFIGDLKASNKNEALEELTDAVVAGSQIKDKNTVLEMLRNREQLGSTALEKGIAFPHGRSLAVKDLTILVARSMKGVSFDSEDGKPTHLFFLLLAPPQDTGNYYLQALGKIAELVRTDSVCDAMMEVADFDALTTLLLESAP